MSELTPMTTMGAREPGRASRVDGQAPSLLSRWVRIGQQVTLIVRLRIAKLRSRYAWPILCALGRHAWEPAPALTKTGEFDHHLPSRYFRCSRPGCQVFRGPLRLGVWGKWQQTEDFLVIVPQDCNKCFGRGFKGRMRLPDGMYSKVPCDCLRVQPAFIEVPANGAARRKLNHEVDVYKKAAGA